MMPVRGKYIVLEGHDGTGKSTQAELLADRLREKGIDTITTKEPGGNEIGEAIRTVLLNGNLEREPTTNLLLYTANRFDLWHRTINPALEKGIYVIATRNYWSSMALQGYGEGLDIEFIQQTTSHFMPEEYFDPDIGIILGLDDISKSRERIAERGKPQNPDTFESKNDDFQNAVINGYREISTRLGLPLVDAQESIDHVHDSLWAIVQKNI